MRCKLLTGVVLSAVLLGPVQAEIKVVAEPGLKLRASFPGELDHEIELDANWTSMRELRVSVTLPEDVPRGTTMLCYLKDAQWNWYQHEVPGTLRSGRTTQVRIDMTPGAQSWFPRGHSRQWDGYVAHKISGFGIKIFNKADWKGDITVRRIYGRTGAEREVPLAVSGLRLNREKVPLYEKFELSFDLSRVYDNPFDPEQVDIRAKFTSPSGKTTEHFAFHYRGYVRRKSPAGYERLTPVGRSCWKVRWTPTEVGRWKVELLLSDRERERAWERKLAETRARVKQTGKSETPPERDDFVVKVRPVQFECTPSDRHGFLRVDPKDPFYFSYTDGTFFYPVGQMLRSPVDLRKPFRGYTKEPREGEGTYAFERMMRRLSENGVNFIRMWMGIWWVGLEAPREYAPGYDGLGRYHMANAWKLDHILDEAHTLGVKLKLNLNNHGQFTRNIDHEWYENCYNVMNGGILTRPAQFWNDAEAAKYYRRRLRYIIARWAYSPEILGWELWNEVDLTEDFNPERVRQWHQRFARHLKHIDPWKHAISTHFCKDERAGPVYSLPEIEFTPGDLYHNNIVSAMRNVWLHKRSYRKATFISEYGLGHNSDQMETNFHGGLWSSTVVPMAGTAMFWWWNFVDAEDLYYHYKPVALFNEGEDRRGRHWQLTSAQVRRGETRHGELQVLGRQNSTEAHLWVYDSHIFNQNNGARYRHPPSFVGCELRVTGLAEGKYRVEFWNTYSGKVTRTDEAACRGGKLRVPLPTVQADLALKIKKLP